MDAAGVSTLWYGAVQEPESDRKLVNTLIGFCGYGNNERILMVDDDEIQRELAQHILGSRGYLVDTASGVNEAVGMIEAETDKYALVLTDVSMPDGTGMDLYNQVSERFKLPFVFSSGQNEEDFRKSSAGKEPFIAKPYIGPALTRLIRNTLDRTSVSSENLTGNAKL